MTSVECTKNIRQIDFEKDPMPNNTKVDEDRWKAKWKRKLQKNIPSKFFMGSNLQPMRQFSYDQTYSALEYLAFSSKQLDSISPLNILEVGCGSGTISINAMKKRPTCNSFMVDSSLEAISIAKRNASEENLHASFVVADAGMLPFKDKTFSLVFSIGLLEHFTVPDQPITEQLRLVKDKGLWAALVVPMKFSMDNFVRPIHHFLRKVYHRENHLFRSFYQSFLTACQSRKPTTKRNGFLDDYYENILIRSRGIANIHSVYLNPFYMPGHAPAIEGFLLRIYRAVVKFRKIFLFHKIPFSSPKCIARSFLITARRMDSKNE